MAERSVSWEQQSNIFQGHAHAGAKATGCDYCVVPEVSAKGTFLLTKGDDARRDVRLRDGIHH